MSPWPTDRSHVVIGSAPSFQRRADPAHLVGRPSSAAEAAVHTFPSSALASAGNWPDPFCLRALLVLPVLKYFNNVKTENNVVKYYKHVDLFKQILLKKYDAVLFFYSFTMLILRISITFINETT